MRKPAYLWGTPLLLLVASLAAGFVLLKPGHRPTAELVPPPAGPEVQAQDPDSACGPVSATLVTRLLGRPQPLEAVRKTIPADPNGATSMSELITGLRSLGFGAVGIRATRSELRHLAGSPLILHVNDNHFVVAVPTAGDSLVVLDPPNAPKKMSFAELDRQWRGNMLLVCNSEDQLAEKLRKLGLRAPEAP
jgi:ABC-type bacteriocin/lantibiotic exporter with double-glycine peptidase domain